MYSIIKCGNPEAIPFSNNQHMHAVMTSCFSIVMQHHQHSAASRQRSIHAGERRRDWYYVRVCSIYLVIIIVHCLDV